MGYPAIRRDFIATGFNDRANHALLVGELESAIPLAARHAVPNLIAMFGNRRGRSDAEATDNCVAGLRSEEHTSELQSRLHLVCRLLLEKKKKKTSLTS